MGFSERRYHLELNGTEQNGTERNWLWQNSNHETVSTGLGQTQIEASRLLGNWCGNLHDAKLNLWQRQDLSQIRISTTPRESLSGPDNRWQDSRSFQDNFIYFNQSDWGLPCPFRQSEGRNIAHSFCWRFGPSLISLVVSVDVRHHVYLLTHWLTHSLTHSLTYLLTYLLTDRLTDWLTDWRFSQRQQITYIYIAGIYIYYVHGKICCLWLNRQQNWGVYTFSYI